MASPGGTSSDTTAPIVQGLLDTLSKSQSSKIRRNFLLAALSLQRWISGDIDNATIPEALCEAVKGTS